MSAGQEGIAAAPARTLDVAFVGDAVFAAAAAAFATACRARVATFGPEVWSLGGGPLAGPDEDGGLFRIDTHDGTRLATATARALVVGAGDDPFTVPFEGWTLTGVMPLHELAGEGRVVLAGAGPALRATAMVARRQGVRVVAVVDAEPCGHGRAQPLHVADVPVLHESRIVRALGHGRVEAVEASSLDGGPVRRFDCDRLCVTHGATQDTLVTRLFGARHEYRPEAGGWVPVLDTCGRSSVPGLYVATEPGDALIRTVLADLGMVPAARLRPVREAAGALPPPPPTLFDAIPDECVVCPCEGVTRGAIERAAGAGARDMNQLKQFTRCGMGACQGRACAETAATLLARRVGDRASVGMWTARVPFRPLPVAAMLRDFDYADIPIPPPAPI